MKFRLLDPREIPWQRLDAFPDRTVFQTRAWVDFLAETQRGTPILAELRDGQAVVGFFTGLTFHRFGIKILGSSFPGWTTPYMGFNLGPGVPRQAALQALEPFVFGDLKCVHMEVCDRCFKPGDGENLGFATDSFNSFETDMRPSEQGIFGHLDKRCRRSIRKAAEMGLTVEEAHDAAFADDFYRQLKEVFRKQGRVPTYGIGRVRALIKHLQPTGHLLLLRARDPNGNCIATEISVGMNKVAEFWGNASFHSGHAYRPNEALHWYAIRYWKQRGIGVLDWGGRAESGDWKEKYNPAPISIPRFHKSRYKVLDTMRTQMQSLIAARQLLLGAFERWFG